MKGVGRGREGRWGEPSEHLFAGTAASIHLHPPPQGALSPAHRWDMGSRGASGSGRRGALALGGGDTGPLTKGKPGEQRSGAYGASPRSLRPGDSRVAC